ncbi:hypothetical protein OG357_05725 [Streptomyces sp. NBC_01255]|uniref:hypothetical protein n=1 Tax=Streptomyces sp. NBC_01255 TaxID=2903798 RepID=UPI002E349F4E|nr:hypothetical protein [Streptomyces sp. NBC_01255]
MAHSLHRVPVPLRACVDRAWHMVRGRARQRGAAALAVRQEYDQWTRAEHAVISGA